MKTLGVSLSLFGMAAAFAGGVFVGRFLLGGAQAPQMPDGAGPPVSATQTEVLPEFAPLSPAEQAALAPPAPAAVRCDGRSQRTLSLAGGMTDATVALEGASCASGTVTITLQRDGGAIYRFSAPLAQMGLGPTPVGEAAVQAAAEQLAPMERPASDLPEWGVAADGAPGPAPAPTDLGRDAWEALRTSGSSLACHRANSAQLRCLTVGADGKAVIAGLLPA